MADTSSSAGTTPVLGSSGGDAPIKTKSPDLRVQLPPVPAFDNTGLGIHNGTTPQTVSSLVQSSLSGALSSPFAPPAINGFGLHPSPIKKKLSLSDYTKSRMNKAAGKTAGGNAVLKPHISSPEDTKVDIIIEPASLEKQEHLVASMPTPATNGAL